MNDSPSACGKSEMLNNGIPFTVATAEGMSDTPIPRDEYLTSDPGMLMLPVDVAADYCASVANRYADGAVRAGCLRGRRSQEDAHLFALIADLYGQLAKRHRFKARILQALDE